jgi:hypothetical protein
MRGHQVDDRLIDAAAVLAAGVGHDLSIAVSGDAVKGFGRNGV